VDIILSEVVFGGIRDRFGLATRVRQQYPGVDVILNAGTAAAGAKAKDLCKDGPLEKSNHLQEIARRSNLLIGRRRRRSFGLIEFVWRNRTRRTVAAFELV
jgi:hypothetical protein